MRIYVEKMELERKRLGLTQAEVEKNAGLRASAYSKVFRRGSASLPTLTRIAIALYLNPHDLITD
jgi:transcriptional regulator with XRE-family HTH domain